MASVLYVANSVVASLIISFFEPFAQLGDASHERSILTEGDFKNRGHLEVQDSDSGQASWLLSELEKISPDLIVFCRYSGPHSHVIVEWAKERGVPTIFHIDDDLLDIPIELGAAKQALHMAPERLATIRYLLAESTVAYCSTPALRSRFFGDAESARVVAGSLYCAHRVRRGPVEQGRPVVGYMGTDHSADIAPVVPAIARLLATRPDVTFEIFGSTPVPDALKSFGDRVRTIAPVRDYAGFMETLEGLSWTIGICALAKTPFNEVKADTKWVEYTACGFAVIASRGTVYDACCSDGCGLLVEGEAEWLEAFERLLDDADARRAQVERAQEKLRRDYSPERLAQQVMDVFTLARERVASLDGSVDARDPASELPAETPGSQIYIDRFINDQVVGWAWSPEDRGRAEGLPVEIWCGDIRLGWCARRVARPDVDAHVSDSSNAKGFELPIGSLYALFRLFDAAPGLHPTARLGSEIFSLPVYGAHLNDLARFRTLRVADGGCNLHVADLWWANSRLLKIRAVDAPAETARIHATSLRVYQPLRTPTGGVALAQVDEQALTSDAAVYPVGLRSPYMPLLLVGCTEAGEIGFVDFLPFPSLLRGGPHETEVAALGDEMGSLSDLRFLSDAYLVECVGGESHPPDFMLSELAIDLSVAVGTEPIFDPSLREWLAAVLRLPVTALNIEERVVRDLGDRSFADYAVAQLERPEMTTARAGQLRLSLAGAAVPTIAGLVSRKTPADDASFAPHIVTDPAAPTKRWLVVLPGAGPLAAETTLGRIARQGFPTLEGNSNGQSDLRTDTSLPLAILFRNLSSPAQAELAFPVPRDQPTILSEFDPGAAPRVSVLVLVEGPERDLRPLLASLAAQGASGAHEVIVGTTANEYEVLQTRQLLNEILPAQARLVTDLDGNHINAALNALASEATGEVLVFLDQSVILHDSRTLDTLARLAAAEGAGTVGCLQLKARHSADSQYALKSAGLFPGRYDFAGRPALALQELTNLALLPKAVYPVAVNRLNCMAVSAHFWREAGGLDATIGLGSHAAVAFAVRAVELGRINICTTLLSVFVEESERSVRGIDVFETARLGPWHLVPAIKASTLIKSF